MLFEIVGVAVCLDAVAHRPIDRSACPVLSCLVCRDVSKTAGDDGMFCLLAPFNPRGIKTEQQSRPSKQDPSPVFRAQSFSPTCFLCSAAQCSADARRTDTVSKKRDRKGGSISSSGPLLLLTSPALPQMARPHPAGGRPGNRKLATAACRAANTEPNQSGPPRASLICSHHPLARDQTKVKQSKVKDIHHPTVPHGEYDRFRANFHMGVEIAM